MPAMYIVFRRVKACLSPGSSIDKDLFSFRILFQRFFFLSYRK
jgi:hypothetical protein